MPTKRGQAKSGQTPISLRVPLIGVRPRFHARRPPPIPESRLFGEMGVRPLFRTLPTAEYPSPIAYRLSPIAYRLSPIAYRRPPIADHLSPNPALGARFPGT